MNIDIDYLKERFTINEIVEATSTQYFLFVEKKDLVVFLQTLKNIYKYTHLAFFTAVDYLEENYFQLTYMLHNYETKLDLAVRVKINRDKPSMDSIHTLWKHAWAYQRELMEMYGIDFPGSPRVDENFILEGWDDIPPMRRDFDTKEYSDKKFYPRDGRSSIGSAEHLKERTAFFK